MKKIQEELKEEKHNNNFFKEEIQKNNSFIKNNNELREEILKKYNFTPEEIKIIHFLNIYDDWLNIRKINMMKSFYYIASTIHKISDITNIDYNIINNYTINELKSLILENKKINEKELVSRRENYLFSRITKDKIILVTKDEAKELYDLALKLDEEEFVKGRVAYKNGIIKGKAKVIIDPSEQEFFQDEILVTSMTRIEFVPLMKKAKAIITDEGGIACHAAIVSRELKIPCIIGTKHATSKIKNGDSLEINTETGIIKIN